MKFDIFRKQSIQNYLGKNIKFSKTMNAIDLISLGVGAVIGTGIFILPSTVAATSAGPGVSLSFVVAAIVCALAGMCYAEFASAIPVAGSAYSYGNIVYGEFTGWIIGWALILEYMLSVATVAAGWSSYFSSFISPFGLKIPKAISGPMNLSHGVYFDLVSVLIILVISILLSQGMKNSIKINVVAVFIKIAIILIFIFVGVQFIKPSNYHPFLPYHFSGVIKGATTVFFAFLGFDVVSSSAAEVKNPKKNMPLGIIGTLAIAAVLYFGVSVVLTGMVNYTKLDVSNPVAFFSVDQLANLVNFGTLFAFTLVSFGILKLRKRTDIVNDGFKVPGYPYLPIISGLICIFMICHLSSEVYLMAIIWLVIGTIIYFIYGYHHSQLEHN